MSPHCIMCLNFPDIKYAGIMHGEYTKKKEKFDTITIRRVDHFKILLSGTLVWNIKSTGIASSNKDKMKPSSFRIFCRLKSNTSLYQISPVLKEIEACAYSLYIHEKHIQISSINKFGEICVKPFVRGLHH